MLRAPIEADLDAYAAMYADAETMRFMGDGHTYDRAETWRTIAGMLGHWALRGFGIWSAVERASGRLVGRIGLYRPEGWPGLEVGWLLSPGQRGKGLATEGGRAALDWSFADLGADHVISVIQPDNAASIRVAERLGECYERTIDLGGQPVAIYGIEGGPGR